MNFKGTPKPVKGIALAGHSSSWPGGGVVVTAENVKAARAMLTAVTAAKVTPAKVTPTADDAAKVSAAKTAAKTTARAAVKRTGVKVTA